MKQTFLPLAIPFQGLTSFQSDRQFSRMVVLKTAICSNTTATDASFYFPTPLPALQFSPPPFFPVLGLFLDSYPTNSAPFASPPLFEERLSPPPISWDA